jgi:hypothetical protein
MGLARRALTVIKIAPALLFPVLQFSIVLV